MMTPDGLNAAEIERKRIAETKRRRDEALTRRGSYESGSHERAAKAALRGSCPMGSCGVTYRLEDGEPEPDSIPHNDPEVDKALRDLFIGLAIAAAYMTILLLVLLVVV